MPRSKRKAKAAASNPDFRKKKAKLGRKARPDNFTNTTVKQKQVFVPDQSRSEEQLASTQTGLSLTDLISRTRHHNANTRTAALNALANAIKFKNATAHSAIILSPAPAINAAAVGIADENAATRTSARNLFVSVWSSLDDVQPFRSIFSTALLACLSHIRLDIRLDGARTLVALLGTNRMSSEQIFADTANPIESLCDILSVTNGVKGRTIVMETICCLSQGISNRADIENGMRKRNRDGSLQAALGKQNLSLPFYYHRSRSVVNDKQSGQLWAKLPVRLASNLITRVANLVTESFPLVETRRDANKYDMFLSASTALHRLVANCSSEVDYKPVQRCLKLWSDEDISGLVTTADINFAVTAIYLGRFDACHDFVVSASKAKSYPSGLEMCIADYIEKCDDDSEIVEAWCDRFEAAAREGNTDILCRSLRICEVVFKRGIRNGGIVFQLLACLPYAIQACLNQKRDSAYDDDTVNLFIKLFSKCYRSLRARWRDEGKMQTVVKNLIDIVCSNRLALHLDDKEVDEIVGILVASDMITADEVVSFIGFCYREGEVNLAERFLMGVEAVAHTDREQKFRAVALARALKLVNSTSNASVEAQLERIEAVVR
ncbi:binding protein [Gracilaria domingensis]|nr:binding protein [Gracilaria domingensis]